MGQPPKVRPQARDPGALNQAGPQDGLHAPSSRPHGPIPLLVSALAPPLGPGSLLCAKGWLEVPVGRQAHLDLGVLGNSMWGSQPCSPPPRSLDPLRPRETGAEGQMRVYVAFWGTSCVPGTTLSNPP